MKFLFVCVLCLCCALLSAQEKLGIANSNYSSSNSIFLNPTSSADSKTYMQFNIIGLNAYAFTNAGYLPDFSVWQILKTGALPTPTLSTIKLKQFAYLNASVDGPSFVMSKRNYGLGVFVRARSTADIKNLPFELVTTILNEDPSSTLPKEDDINVRNLKAANMTWVEYGGNFAYMVKKNRQNIWTLGGNLRRLTGINVFYANLLQTKGRYNDTLVKLDTLRGKLNYNQPAWNSGKGWGLDIGVTYKKMLENAESYYAHSTQSNCKHIDYKYKLSATLRDVGYINFKKGGNKGSVNASGYFYVSSFDTSLAYTLEKNFTSTLTTNVPVLASMPTNLVLQGDWNFENGMYLNATFIKNLIPNRVVGVQGANLISIAPRFELKQFEVAMPLTFQRFIYPQLGLALRYRTFVLGFDNVFPLVYKKNTYGLNVYFSLGFSLFKNKACNTKSLSVANCPKGLFSGRLKRKHSKKVHDKGHDLKWLSKKKKKR